MVSNLRSARRAGSSLRSASSHGGVRDGRPGFRPAPQVRPRQPAPAPRAVGVTVADASSASAAERRVFSCLVPFPRAVMNERSTSTLSRETRFVAKKHVFLRRRRIPLPRRRRRLRRNEELSLDLKKHVCERLGGRGGTPRGSRMRKSKAPVSAFVHSASPFIKHFLDVFRKLHFMYLQGGHFYNSCIYHFPKLSQWISYKSFLATV